MNDLSDKQKTRVIIELLKLRHPAPEWAHFVEMRFGTGFGGGGGMDFYAFNLWPSKKFHRVAYEIKVSRGDFTRELLNPKKRERAEMMANECFFATPVGLVKPDEIPERWGLVEATKGGMRRKKHAMQREIADPSILFVAALARRLSDPPPEYPLPFWKYAGRTLTLDELYAIAQEKLDVWKGEVANEAIKQFKKEETYVRREAISSLIYDKLGYEYREPDKLREWFEARGGDEAVISQGLRWRLNDVRNSLNRLLKEKRE
jgi:hypothetical protein